MSKGLIFSDLHVHKHKDRVDRLNHCLEVLEWVFSEADKEGCTDIFFLGDLFHDRAKIDVLVYLKVFECVAKNMEKYDVKLWLLVGNHDMYHRERWDVNSVQPLSVIPNVFIVDTPTTIEVGGKKINWLPHVENPFSAMDDFKKEGIGDILFAHLAVHNAKFNLCYGTRADVIVEYDNDLKPVDADSFGEWDAVFLGHYHAAQDLSNNVEYVGSPLELNFGEAFQEKHIIVLDLKTMKKKYIKNEFSPKHLIVKEIDIDYDTYQIDGNFVRIEVDDIGKQKLIDLKQKIQKNHDVLSLEIKQRERKTAEEESEIIEDAKSILTDQREMLQTYVKDAGVPKGLNKKKLLEVGSFCIEEASYTS